MAVNRVDVNGSTVLDLTNDSVTPETLTLGVTAHNAAGEQITGTYEAPVTSVNEQTGDVVVTAESIGAQQKLYNLTLDTPIVENQTINPNSTYTFSSPITLNEYDIYWIDVQTVYEGKVQNRYQLLSIAVNGDSGITVQWMGYIILDTTGVTLEISSDSTYIITIAKVLDYERPVASTIAHQEGEWCIASCTTAHVEGSNTVAFGKYSHAEGQNTTASSDGSHSEGISTIASGMSSHAEGWDVIASGTGSHAEGYCTKASSRFQHVQGRHNIEDSYNNYAHIVGNGNDDSVRSNAHTLDWSGNAWFAGDVYVGSTSGTHKDAGSKKLATESTTVITTLSVSSWDSSTKTQTVSVAGVTAGTNGSLRIAQSATDEQFTAWGAAQLRVTAQAAGTLTVKAAGTVPPIDIPVEVLIV